MSIVRRIRKEIRLLRARLARGVDLSVYRDDPVGYAREILGVEPTPTQEAIGRACLEPPYRVLVPSGHDVGKTYWGAVLVSWWYDTRNPSVCLTTAPKLDQVKDLLWKEIRAQRTRRGLGGFTGPKSLRLESSPKHFAKGVTANSQAGFQGQHEKNVMVLIDEAEGVERDYIESAKTMASGAGHCIVCFYNPYSSTSHVAQEESAVDENGKPSWRLIRMSSLDHPNIAAELRGEPPPIPQAVRLVKVRQWVQDWCEPLTGDDAKATDIFWPPEIKHDSAASGLPTDNGVREKKIGRWYRPGPRFEAGVLGRRPTMAVDSVWSSSLVDAMIDRELPMSGRIQIGCDIARFGDDDTVMHVKIGGSSVHHEAVNGWTGLQVAKRLQWLASHWGEKVGLAGRRVPIAMDAGGGYANGPAETLWADGWSVYLINGSRTEGVNTDEYPNLRTALWFGLAEEAAKGNVSIRALPFAVQQQLRRELPAQLYQFDGRGRRYCVDKSVTKATLGRSPDNAEGFLLAYALIDKDRDSVAGCFEVIE